MTIDTGLAVVIIAVLIFYLRLIILQRERAKRAALPSQPIPKKKRKGLPETVNPAVTYSILSRSRVDLAIAGAGLLAILLGLVLNAGWLALPAAQPYWWLPTSAGIVAFSWAFKL